MNKSSKINSGKLDEVAVAVKVVTDCLLVGISHRIIILNQSKRIEKGNSNNHYSINNYKIIQFNRN